MLGVLFSLFEESVHIILHRWTALQICIDQDLAGANSIQKLAQLHALITSFFLKEGLSVTTDRLEESLGWFFTDMFNVALEDGSAREVAARMCGLFGRIVVSGDGQVIEEMRRLTSGGAKDSDIQCIMSDDSESESDKDIAMSTSTTKTEPEIDDDGFQLIQKGHSRH